MKVTNNNYIALIKYANGSLSFIFLPNGLLLGHFVNTQIYLYRLYKSIILGRCIPLKFLKKFSLIFNVSLRYKNSSSIATASGTFCRLIKHYSDLNLSKIKLPSGKKYIISSNCFVVLGRNSNLNKKKSVLGGAKFNVLNGKKPCVRGVAMNPVDHPHGGRTKTNSPEVSP